VSESSKNAGFELAVALTAAGGVTTYTTTYTAYLDNLKNCIETESSCVMWSPSSPPLYACLDRFWTSTTFCWQQLSFLLLKT